MVRLLLGFTYYCVMHLIGTCNQDWSNTESIKFRIYNWKTCSQNEDQQKQHRIMEILADTRDVKDNSFSPLYKAQLVPEMFSLQVNKIRASVRDLSKHFCVCAQLR